MNCALVVLGGGVDDDGNMPSWVHARLEKALEEWKKGIYSHLITSGKARTSETKGSEADSMAKFLVKHGIPRSQILTEEKSTSTIENAYFCKVDHIDRLGVKDLTIITNQFHIVRAGVIFKFIFQPNYSITLVASDDTGIPADVLEILMQADIELSHFLEDNIFNNIRPGNQSQIESFIFDKNDKNYKRLVEYKVNSSLYKEVTRLMT